MLNVRSSFIGNSKILSWDYAASPIGTLIVDAGESSIDLLMIRKIFIMGNLQ
jgi:hypothetical protein